MKILVDECVTIQLLPHITGHDVTHMVDTAWRGMKNGVLLRLVHTQFDVFLTTDRHIPEQQNLRTFDLAFVILRGVSNKLEDLRLLATLRETGPQRSGALCGITKQANCRAVI